MGGAQLHRLAPAVGGELAHRDRELVRKRRFEHLLPLCLDDGLDSHVPLVYA